MPVARARRMVRSPTVPQRVLPAQQPIRQRTRAPRGRAPSTCGSSKRSRAKVWNGAPGGRALKLLPQKQGSGAATFKRVRLLEKRSGHVAFFKESDPLEPGGRGWVAGG